MAEYVIHGCVERITGDRIDVKTVPGQEAEFFGVYETLRDGTEKWIADFDSYDDAAAFLLLRGEARRGQ
jgi:hypothetical protein